MSFGQTVSQLSIRNVEALRANTEFDVSRSDRNNNDKACSRSTRVDSPVLASPTLADDPQALLSRGPEYLRSLIFKRQSAFQRPVGQRSATELLQQSKPRFALLDTGASPAMSLGASPTKSAVDVLEDMSSESNLVESMVTKLCIPRTESLEGGDVGHTSSPPNVNPQAALRTAMVGKRRMCTRADDTYGGQKQRQRLGSAEMDVAKESAADDFGSDGKTKNDPEFPAANAPGGFVHSGNWPCGESGAEKTRSFGPGHVVGGNVSGKWVDKSDQASQSRETDVDAGCRYGDECSMDVEAKQPSADPDSDSKHRCDGAMCRGVDKGAEPFKPGGEEVEFRATFAVARPPGAGEWRELRADGVPGTDRIEEAKGVRMFRRYKKIAGKSGSRSDLTSRHPNPSEHGNVSVRNSADLDAFFAEMGMDRGAIASALNNGHLDHTLSSTASLNVFENISSVGTPLDSQSCASRDSQPADDSLLGKPLDPDDRVGPGMSIVERNARVIRWLCNIRKASTVTDDGEV